MARPAPLNLGQAALLLTQLLGKTSIDSDDIKWLSENSEKEKPALEQTTKQFLDEIFPVVSKSFTFASLNTVAFWKEIIQQISLVEIKSYEDLNLKITDEQLNYPIFRLNKLMAFDPIEVDRSMGVCSVPLYEFQASEIEVFHTGKDIDNAREILKRHNVFQYFFPAADQLTLGLIENTKAPVEMILNQLSKVPSMGHPFGESEIISADVKLFEIISVLKEQGLAIEGEVGLELTPSGMATRSTVRFKPREGLLSKLLNIFSFKFEINLKDLLK